jgi:hypothetical protein
MQLLRKDGQDKMQFVIVDAPDKYHDVLRSLAFGEVDDGFAKSFPHDTPHLNEAFIHLETHLETVLQQAAKAIPVPWEAALEAFLKRTAEVEADWFVVGSAALALKGIAIRPGDIDLVVDTDGVRRWNEALADVMIEPVIRRTDWFFEYWGRAFLHARIEWAGGIDLDDQSAYVQEYFIPASKNLETIHWRGYDFRIGPIAPQLRMDAARGRMDRVKLMQEFLDREG